MKHPNHVRLEVVPISYKVACEFVTNLHRHHKAPGGQKFAIGVVDPDGMLRGVAMCGRPVARHYDDGLTLEINRTCVDDCPNSNSALYGACRRIAAAMGYTTVITYTEEGETGVSLRAADFYELATRKPRKNWADSSVTLSHIRDPDGRGGVQRKLWIATLRDLAPELA